MPRPTELNAEELELARSSFKDGRHKPEHVALIILLGRALKRPAASVAEEWYELHRMVKKFVYNLPSHMEG